MSTEQAMVSLPKKLEEAKNEEGVSRPWGTIVGLGSYPDNNQILVNFVTNKVDYTLIVPPELEQLALIALQQKLTVLAGINSNPIKSYATITSLVIYN